MNKRIPLKSDKVLKIKLSGKTKIQKHLINQYKDTVGGRSYKYSKAKGDVLITP